MLADKFAEHFQWLDYDVRKYDTREMKTIVANGTNSHLIKGSNTLIIMFH